MRQKKSVQIFNYFFKRIEVGTKCLAANFGDRVKRICFPADKSFLYLYVVVVFQRFKVCSQIAISNIYQRLKIVEVDRLGDHERTHDADADAAIEYLVQLFYRVAH
jgi:hypothetical protein